jgi:hypothetical protein
MVWVNYYYYEQSRLVYILEWISIFRNDIQVNMQLVTTSMLQVFFPINIKPSNFKFKFNMIHINHPTQITTLKILSFNMLNVFLAGTLMQRCVQLMALSLTAPTHDHDILWLMSKPSHVIVWCNFICGFGQEYIIKVLHDYDYIITWLIIILKEL